MPQILELDLSRHLDRYETPVIMVDEEGRIVGLNQRMSLFLNKAREEVLGLLGGELMGCRYSNLPEGCGQTIHCGTCSIRQTVNKARSLGTDILDVPAYLDLEDQRMYFRISAFNQGKFVKVVVEKAAGSVPLSSE
jgi:PAS domain-containing protein